PEQSIQILGGHGSNFPPIVMAFVVPGCPPAGKIKSKVGTSARKQAGTIRRTKLHHRASRTMGFRRVTYAKSSLIGLPPLTNFTGRPVLVCRIIVGSMPIFV